jgi:predicted ArsR family transcriptional regulator
MSTFYIKQNDTAPAIRATLKSGSGTPIDLTNATVRFHMKDLENTVIVDAEAEVILPVSSGVVQYVWQTGDTDTVGAFKAEFEVTYSNSQIETFPNDSNIAVSISPEVN